MSKGAAAAGAEFAAHVSRVSDVREGSLWLTRKATSVCITALLALFPMVSLGQSAGARDYLNTPVDATSFFIDLLDSKLGTANSDADGADFSLPDNEGTVRAGVVSLLYSFPLGTQYGGVALSGGRSSVEIQTPSGTLEATGFTDPSLTFHVNFFGAPALRIEEFRSVAPQSFSSLHLTVTAPLGSYDRNSPVNVGANRWTFTPLLNLSLTHDEGVSWIDLYAGVRFYGNNDAFKGTNQLSQHPLGTLTVHYSHNLGEKMWFSVGVYYDQGGETYINKVPQHDGASGFRPSLGLSRRFGNYRVGLRLDSTASSPTDLPTNRALFLRVSGPLF